MTNKTLAAVELGLLAAVISDSLTRRLASKVKSSQVCSPAVIVLLHFLTKPVGMRLMWSGSTSRRKGIARESCCPATSLPNAWSRPGRGVCANIGRHGGHRIFYFRQCRHRPAPRAGCQVWHVAIIIGVFFGALAGVFHLESSQPRVSWMILLPGSSQFGEKLRIPRLFYSPEAGDVLGLCAYPAGPSWIRTFTSKRMLP